MKKIHEIKTVVNALPDKKRYAEFITAVLSVPVLITVLIMNVYSVKKINNAPQETTEKVIAAQIQSTTPIANKSSNNGEKPTPATSPNPSTTISVTPQACVKEVGPIDIVSPSEGETTKGSPVCIDIARTGKNYCEVAWSYRIDNDPWSEYMSKSICLYNLSPGQKTIQVRVKSIASSDETVLKRTFTVMGPNTSPTPTASSSGTIQ